MNNQFTISIKEQSQDNKIFPEGDGVLFDPLFKRLRENRNKSFIKSDKWVISLNKSIERGKHK